MSCVDAAGGRRRSSKKWSASSSHPALHLPDGPLELTTYLRDTHGVASSPPAQESNSPVPNITTTTSATSVLLKRTPARSAIRRQSQLPPSPADVADLAEYETSQIYAGLSELYTFSGIPETIEHLRDLCSSVTGVQMAFMCLESLALQREVLPWEYITCTGPISWLGGLNINFYFPNLWHVLEPGFWFPTLLWGITSLAFPSLMAYFFNLSIHDVKRHGARVSVARYPVDPLTFNVVKALSTYIIYGQGWAADVIGPMTVAQVSNAMYGGYRGVLIGCYVCILACLYDAAQRK